MWIKSKCSFVTAVILSKTWSCCSVIVYYRIIIIYQHSLNILPCLQGNLLQLWQFSLKETKWHFRKFTRSLQFGWEDRYHCNVINIQDYTWFSSSSIQTLCQHKLGINYDKCSRRGTYYPTAPRPVCAVRTHLSPSCSSVSMYLHASPAIVPGWFMDFTSVLLFLWMSVYKCSTMLLFQCFSCVVCCFFSFIKLIRLFLSHFIIALYMYNVPKINQ